MRFYYLSSSDQPIELVFDEPTKLWKASNGATYFCGGSCNPTPIQDNPNEYACLPGYFVVEVTDSKGNKGTFKLHAANEIVSCGGGTLHPGVEPCKEAAADLEASGLIKPEDGFDFLVECINYGFHEGPVVAGSVELPIETEDETGPVPVDIYLWKVL